VQAAHEPRAHERKPQLRHARLTGHRS
jgi:hypothetical protein